MQIFIFSLWTFERKKKENTKNKGRNWNVNEKMFQCTFFPLQLHRDNDWNREIHVTYNNNWSLYTTCIEVIARVSFECNIPSRINNNISAHDIYIHHLSLANKNIYMPVHECEFVIHWSLSFLEFWFINKIKAFNYRHYFNNGWLGTTF